MVIVRINKISAENQSVSGTSADIHHELRSHIYYDIQKHYDDIFDLINKSEDEDHEDYGEYYDEDDRLKALRRGSDSFIYRQKARVEERIPIVE